MSCLRALAAICLYEIWHFLCRTKCVRSLVQLVSAHLFVHIHTLTHIFLAISLPVCSNACVGLCYIDTANLDGETNLKQRRAVRCTDTRAYGRADIEFEVSPVSFCVYYFACVAGLYDQYLRMRVRVYEPFGCDVFVTASIALIV